MACEVIVDNINREDWERYAGNFADYSIYQTWAYQEVRGDMDKENISRVIIKDELGQAVLMCQVRIKQVKLLGLRIGYVQWGPMIRTIDGQVKCSVKTLELLREAYVGTRVNVLRVVPNIYTHERGDSVTDMFHGGGFECVHSVVPYRTMMFPLDTSEKEMRSRLHRKWRSVLKKAEQRNIEIREGSDDAYLATLDELYASAQKRKKFKGLDMQVFRRTQQLLLPWQKMNVVLAYQDGEPLTADVTSYLGDTATGIFQASSEKAFRCGASYLVWWRAFLAARRASMRRYDLGGVHPDDNPSVYQFKLRMGADEASHIGVFEACSSLRARITWRAAEKIYRTLKR